MNIPEYILTALSRAPGSEDFKFRKDEATIDNALSLLETEYHDFGRLVSGKRVADFGCGKGLQSVALARKYSCRVTGIDSNRKFAGPARELAEAHGLHEPDVSFTDKISADMRGRFDIVLSQNSFEHFSGPGTVLEEMGGLLNASGKLLITFGPPWLAPYGSHMYFFCKLPWLNVLFPEKTVMKVRGRFRADGAARYEDIESGLNKMTISKFEGIAMAGNWNIEFTRYKCIKGINWLSRVPGLREFFINRVTVVLSKKSLSKTQNGAAAGAA